MNLLPVIWLCKGIEHFLYIDFSLCILCLLHTPLILNDSCRRVYAAACNLFGEQGEYCCFSLTRQSGSLQIPCLRVYFSLNHTNNLYLSLSGSGPMGNMCVCQSHHSHFSLWLLSLLLPLPTLSVSHLFSLSSLHSIILQSVSSTSAFLSFSLLLLFLVFWGFFGLFRRLWNTCISELHLYGDKLVSAWHKRMIESLCRIVTYKSSGKINCLQQRI